MTPFAISQAQDKPIIIAAGNDGLFRKLCAALRRPDRGADPRLATNESRRGRADALSEMIEAVLGTHPAAHWLALFDGQGIPAGPINTVAEALAHPQVAARRMVVQAGGERIVGNPVKIHPFAANDDGVRAPAPLLDGDRKSLLEEFP